MSTDVIHRFSFVTTPIRGQWVRLDATLAALLGNQPYPPAIRALLAEMLAAVSLIADGITFRGAVALQARGTGPVTTVLAECREQHLLRGIARWTEDAGLVPDVDDLAALLGDGRMAVSLVPDPDDLSDTPGPGNDRLRSAPAPRQRPLAQPYQGVVSLGAGSLAASLEAYFTDSEQLPTRLFTVFDGRRVTGLLLQRLPAAPNATEFDLDAHQALWEEAQLLAETLQSAELARWPVEELLHKLFHQHPLTLHPGRPLAFACTCSRARAERMLAALPKSEILELLAERGVLDVTCEICGTRYEYDQIDTRVLYEPVPPQVH